MKITLIELIQQYPCLTFSFKNNPIECLQHIQNIQKLDNYLYLKYVIIGNENKLQSIKKGKYIYPDFLIIDNNKIIERTQLKFKNNKILSKKELNIYIKSYINEGFCDKIEISFKSEILLNNQIKECLKDKVNEKKLIFSKINPKDLENLNETIYLKKKLLTQKEHKKIIDLFKKEINENK